ncbi:acyltransferase family protein [Oerskovia douganii]|uniref:acyltransferase family protein n=1 Tax=Oerskovia douganii TaxID=2762210 RepID=UPI002AB26CE1|nr:acyltransferase family protein [Oerskovia douganii]
MAVVDVPQTPVRPSRPSVPTRVSRARPTGPAARARRPHEPALRRRDPAPTTARRDVFVDAVRALATLAVLSVHWLMPEVTWDGERLGIGNALAYGGAWTLTWVLQVLPLLFFAAGASAAYQLWRRPDGAARLPGARHQGDRAGSDAPGLVAAGWDVVRRRMPRIWKPVAAFVGAWAVAVVALPLLGVPEGAVRQVARIAPQLLWFLGVYLLLLAITPALLRAYRAWGWRAVAAVVAAPLVVDVLRFAAGLEQVAVANVLLGWAVPYVLGIAYVDLVRRDALPARRTLALVAGAALAAMVALVVLGPYPPSLIGMPGDAISNLGPPTALAVVHAVLQVSVALAVRDAVVRWAGGRGAALVTWVAARSMTLYLWHLTAMFVVLGVVLLGLGTPLPASWSADWWAARPLWFGAAGLVLAGLVRVFGRLETPATGRVTVPVSAEGRAPSTAGGAASRPAREPARVPAGR